MNRRPLIMGIVNVTPDSFSGDGRVDPAAALDHAESLVAQGADCLDIGACSSRPGAPFVDQDTECARLLPALSLIRRALPCPLFVDTTRPAVAKAALDLGVQGINTIEGLSVPPALWDVLTEYPQTRLILMHNPLPFSDTIRDETTPPQSHPSHVYPQGVMTHVRRDLKAVIDTSPLHPSQILLDPGVGFGKSVQDNVVLIQGLGDLATLGYPVVLGVSRKSFLGAMVNKTTPERIPAGLAAMLFAAPHVAMMRTHDVGALADAFTVWGALAQASPPSPTKTSDQCC
ncbi:MAG: dihydropteroate synthase [Alphaproteobacteria bacterium]